MSTRGKKGWILAFSLPCLVLFCLVYAIPFVMVITTSFCDYSLTQSPVFEGLKNESQDIEEQLTDIKKGKERTEEEIKEYLSGNLCRCSGYEGQLRGILNFLAWKKQQGGAS